MPDEAASLARRALPADIPAAARLLDAFNVEFAEQTPGVPALTRRLLQLCDEGDTLVLLVGEGPDGVAVLRFRSAIWNSGQECHLAELYVTPALRGKGLGGALLDTALREATERGALTMDIGVDEPDLVARHLYESFGFTNRTEGGTGPLMFVYERAL